MDAECDIAVVGGGPAGLLAAVALATAGVETVLVAPPAPEDVRTTALLVTSVMALEALAVWPHCATQAAPLRYLRIVDDTARLLRAPEVTFAAAEIGLEAFGYNIANGDLIAALEARARTLPALARRAEAAVALSLAADGDRAELRLASGARVAARLVIGADGRRSLCRRAAGIATDTRSDGQMALALVFRHARPHGDTSTEFHTEDGPFTTVPLPGRRSSLVWVTGPGTARRLADSDDATLSAAIERRSHAILGATEVEDGRGLFPLAVQSARRLTAERLALIGEAAHVLPPIGAQGLNLGLRDAAQIAELAILAHRAGADVGAPHLLARYEALRRADIAARRLAVDLLNRSLLTDFLPVQGLRGLGLHLLQQIGPLRRFVMRQGIAPVGAEPMLMRGVPI
jgi:2-octaprenyl-6-methoxyphenol hydroxylase